MVAGPADEELVAVLDAVGRRGFAYAWQMLRNHDDALDAVQSALAAVWAGRRRLQAGRDPRGWFYRTLRNKCVDVLRRRRARAAAPLDYDPPARDVADPPAHAETREALVDLRQALDELPEEMREILLLRDYHDLSYAEVAEVFRIPMGTVMSRLHRARLALRDRLRDDR
ncbi:MAG: RNA polymerase sigma factor [Phycisphaerae bacterium]|jgi:RNA polymerase sigma-70 factor (ECF subfamily)